jgi:TPR repeat protein
MRKNGNPAAKIALGRLYETGVPGIEKDLGQAVQFFRQAGSLGEAELERLSRAPK